MRSLILSLWLYAYLSGSLALAHQMPRSRVLLDIHATDVGAELQLPADRLQVALRHDPAVLADGRFITGDEMLGADRARTVAYVLRHVHANAPDGRAWSVRAGTLNLLEVPGGQDLVVHLMLQPPPGAPAYRFDLGYDVIIREVVTHAALISVSRGWRSGVMPDTPELVGAVGIRMGHLLVDRSGGSAWRGFCSIFRLGLLHIAEGTDHLLFLLTLLLPAPLLVKAHRWSVSGPAKRSVLQVVKIVSAFTIGHSITLALGTLGLLRLPQPPIEFLIATSILVSAIHALRPIFPGREYMIAAGFGLIHGASFAAVLSELGLDPWGMAVGIAGFNLGIEVMQMTVVLITMPWLILLSTTALYPAVRIGGASFAAIAAAGWMLERATNLSNPVGPAVDGLAAHPAMSVAALALGSVAAKMAKQLGSGSRTAVAAAQADN